MTTTKSHIGKSMFFATALPATNDAAGFEALTWVKVEGFQGGAQFGFDHADIDVEDLQSGLVPRLKGMGTGAASTLSFRKVATDTEGQGGLKTLADGVGTVGSIKIGRGSGAGGALTTGDPVEYAQGYFKSYTSMEATSTSHEGFTVIFQQNAPSVEDDEPA